jgi:hypothetical protein
MTAMASVKFKFAVAAVSQREKRGRDIMMKKYGRITIVVLVVFLVSLIFASGTLADKKKGFNGAWESIDSVDGSYQVMVIQDSYPYFMYNDFGATICGTDTNGQPIYPGSIYGSPVIVGDTLTVEGKVLCITENPYYTPAYRLEFTFNKNKDTILFGSDTWYRIEK